MDCIRTFFKRRFGYESYLYPKFKLDTKREFDLDIQVSASGFSKKDEEVLQEYLEEVREVEGEFGSDVDFDVDSSDESEDQVDELEPVYEIQEVVEITRVLLHTLF